MTQKMHFLWATPRSTSTAFEWMMRMRGDMACFHEPFGEPWYLGPEALCPRPPEADKLKAESTFAAVWNRLNDVGETRTVFAKDMPHHTEHMWDDDFLARMNHAFLIRDPAKVLASLNRSYQKAGMAHVFEPHEVSFPAQLKLFHILADRDGAPPPVVDSDDLLADPPAMVSAYCAAIGEPFIEKALTWEPGDRSEVLWYDGDDSVWHESLKNSDGLKAQPRKEVRVDDLPDVLRRQYDLFMPIYEEMRAYRIGV